MKFCSHCGKEIMDEAVICVNCGCSIEGVRKATNNHGLLTAAKIFMIISCVIYAITALSYTIMISYSGLGYILLLYWLPLSWAIPMTCSLFDKIKNKERISTAFKVCTLLFVSLVAGILLLCVNDNQQ